MMRPRPIDPSRRRPGNPRPLQATGFRNEHDRSLDFDAKGNPEAFTCTRCSACCGVTEKITGHCTDCVLYLRGSPLRPTDPREWKRNARLAAVGEGAAA